MAGIQLTQSEQKIADELNSVMERLRAHLDGKRLPQDEVHRFVRELGRLGHALHNSLASRALEPRHHRYMVENRELEPSHPEFYAHMHPVEDLFRFIREISANDDPPDVTMGAEFVFRAYSRRWGHDDLYKMVRTAGGWDVSFISIGGPCDQEGGPYLFRNLQHDCISYPQSLAHYVAEVWRDAATGADWNAVQSRLDELAEWVRVTESTTPDGQHFTHAEPEASALNSVFICFGQPDASFARALERGLTGRGVATRFFEKHARPGEALHRFMWKGIADQDRVIVICSKEGLERPGVQNEIEQAFTKEAELGGRELLIPVALDDWLFDESATDELRKRLRSRVACRCFSRNPSSAVDEILPVLRQIPGDR